MALCTKCIRQKNLKTYTKNGKIIAKLSNPFEDRIQLVNSLVGIIPDTMTLEEAREERLSRI